VAYFTVEEGCARRCDRFGHVMTQMVRHFLPQVGGSGNNWGGLCGNLALFGLGRLAGLERLSARERAPHPGRRPDLSRGERFMGVEDVCYCSSSVELAVGEAAQGEA